MWGEKGGNKGRGGYWSKGGSRCWCCFFFLFFRCFFFRSFCCGTVFSVIRISQSIAIVVEGFITYLSSRSQSCVGAWCCFFFLFFRCFFFRSFCCGTVFSVIRISQSIAIVVEGIITYLSSRSQSCVGAWCCFFFLFFRCFLVFYFRRWSRCWCCFFFLFFRCFLVFYFRRLSRCWCCFFFLFFRCFF